MLTALLRMRRLCNSLQPMSKQNIRIAVTGATGYLGSRLCHYFKDRCSSTIQLTSNPDTANPSLPREKFSLTNGIRKGFFSENDVDVLVHAAYDFRPKSRRDIWDTNVSGSIALFKQARAEGVNRIVFISSMSAYEGCRSLYGNAKLEIEAALSDDSDSSCVRPGLIYSTPLNESHGMVGSILGKVKDRNILPLIGGGKQVLYLTHEEDLGRFCFWLATRPSTSSQSGPKYFITANQKPYLFREIVEQVLINSNRSNVKLVSVPWRSVWLVLKSLEAVHLSTDFRSDSVLSLAYQDKQPDFSTLPSEFIFRDFSEAISL
jgi:nucleoside-diphosphate-sugar epimerase